jgi:UDP-N-acetylmuramoylalanine--D-glutamate ligase
VEAYARDKLSLASQPGARLTICADDAELRARRDLLGPEVEWVDGSQAEPWWHELGLVGRHNAVNAALAAALLVAAGIDAARDDDKLRAAAGRFGGLESRLQRVVTAGGVEFYDDSLSTNVLPTIAAVDAFPGRRVALILGGFDRGIDYAPLARHLAGRESATLALTIPDNGDRIATALEAVGAPDLEIVRCADLASAVARAFHWALPDGIVLLSPAAPSFGRFRDYRERADVFEKLARECRP